MNELLKGLKNEVELMKRHLEIYKVIAENQPIGIVKISDVTGYPVHLVRYSVAVLKQIGLVQATKRGCVITDESVNIDKISKLIDELLDALGGDE